MAGQQIIQAQPAGLQAATLRAAAPTAATTPQAAAAQQIITLPNGQQAIVAGAAAAAAAPQIMQMPQTVQQMALVPVSGPNGQTVYQQVPVPVQVAAPAQTTALVPVAVQTSSGQQIIMQQVRISEVWGYTLYGSLGQCANFDIGPFNLSQESLNECTRLVHCMM